MKKVLKLFIACACIISFNGCANLVDNVTEPFKVVWGSSTRALENARMDAIKKKYDCRFDECFNAVLSLNRKKVEKVDEALNEEIDESVTGSFDVFIKNRQKRHIVVMGVEGNVETTEVGIFFSGFSSNTTIEISSLSSSAKRRVAEAVFKALDGRFSQVE